jgi:predicted AAA+ superfamily ATPase
MKRDRLKDLATWRTDPYRKPLIVKGCRQVGKSWLIREFGKQFSSFVEINFEKNKLIHQYFSADLNVNIIIEKLSIHAHQKIEAGKTLLFFDEVQACEGALQSLRYFKEEMPEMHIIAAGSLLEFTLNKIGIPVGRVQFMHIYPLSFAEYLTTLGYQDIRDFLFKKENDPVLHDQLLDHLKNYTWLGGMPAVIDAWIKDHDPVICQKIQDEIIESYQIDFHKYAKQREIPHVTTVFEAIPAMLGKKFKYAHVNSDIRSDSLKNALLLLDAAGIIKRCFHTSAQHPPLGAEQDEKKFKVYYFDIGIATRLLGLDIKQWLLKPLQPANHGGIVEQFVAQEMVAYSDYHKASKLYYWHREAKSSNAEVDFVVMKNGEIIPVEVKSSHKGGMKSMQLFLESHPNSKFGLKISQGQFSQHGKFYEIPLYALESWLAENGS